MERGWRPSQCVSGRRQNHPDHGIQGRLGLPSLPPLASGDSCLLIHSHSQVDAALRNCVDTPTALKSLEQLVRATNVFMGAVGDTRRGATLLGGVERYFHSMMNCFGVEFEDAGMGAGGGAGAAGAGAGAEGGTASPAQLAAALSEFRDAVRQAAIAGKGGKGGEGGKGGDADADGGAAAAAGANLPVELLQLCDALRDSVLPPLGVKVDDRPSGVAQWTLEDPKLLMAEAERAREMAAKSEEMRRQKLADKAARAARDAARASVAPSAMFLPEHDTLFEREASHRPSTAPPPSLHNPATTTSSASCARQASYGGIDPSDGLPTLDGGGEPPWSKWPSWRHHSWPPRAPQAASQGLRLLYALGRRGPAAQTTAGSDGSSAKGRPT